MGTRTEQVATVAGEGLGSSGACGSRDCDWAGRHVSAEELRAALKRGLPPARRSQWVRQLGGLCPRFLAVLEQFAELAKEWKSGEERVGRDDLVLLAVERLRLLEEISDGPNAELEDVSPWLWLGLREARRVPLGFCRLILEESLFQARSRIHEPVDLTEDALSMVKPWDLAVDRRARETPDDHLEGRGSRSLGIPGPSTTSMNHSPPRGWRGG